VCGHDVVEMLARGRTREVGLVANYVEHHLGGVVENSGA
jgi:hypothetical protein